MIKCPNQPVYIGHGWHLGTATRTRDPYNKLFFHFRTCTDDCASSNASIDAKYLTSAAADAAPPYPISYRSTPRCPHQSMPCDEDLSMRLFRFDTVNVLTRTAMRPNFFLEARGSVTMQTHRHIRHIVLTDDSNSLV